MGHNDNGKAQVPCAFARDLPQRGEGCADDGYGGNTEILKLYRVTRGPGGRGPSVTDAVDDGIALCRHLLGKR